MKKLVLLLVLAVCHFAHAETKVLVAAASDLQFVFPELIAQYEAAHPEVKIGATYGSSGKFYEQIRNGAPFDLFLSADAAFPKKLIGDGKAAESDFFFYGIGRLVVWVRKTSTLDLGKKGIGVAVDSAVKKIAIANPEHAPYGRAAVAALQKLGLYNAVKDKLVLGENVVQAAQFAETGAADIGLIGLSLALAPRLQSEGKYVEVPLDSYPKLEQGGVVLATANIEETRKFKASLESDATRIILQKYGFALPLKNAEVVP